MLTVAVMAIAAFAPEVAVCGIVRSESGLAAATLVHEGRARTVAAGDRAFGCDVAAIHAVSVDLICAGERMTLALTQAKPDEAGDLEMAVPAMEESPAGLTFTRADLEARLDREMSRLMTETTLVPVTSRGQVAGFTLSRIPAGTILETLGLKAGDVLVSVNDTPIDSFTTLVGLWPSLQDAGSVRAQFLRDGKDMDISVRIR